MKILPNHNFTIQTTQSLPQVVEKLAHFIEPPQLRWSFSRDRAPYRGTISDTKFEIQRVINYRNSLLPLIRGQFEALPNGTAIHITMKLHPFTIGFLIFWFLFWYSFSIPTATAGAMPNNTGLLFLGLPMLILFAFWWAFWHEVELSQRQLEQIILAQQTQEEISRDFKQHSLKSKRLWITLSLVWLGVVLWQIANGQLIKFVEPEKTQVEVTACSGVNRRFVQPGAT